MTSTRRLKQKEEVREAILEAARGIVQAEGWQAVSIRKIADAIGYSLPVVYTHFENKDAILEEFIKIGFCSLNAELLKAKKADHTPEEQLAVLADAYFKFAFTQREYYQMMFGLGMPSCDRVAEISEIAAFSELIFGCLNEIKPALSPDLIYLKFQTFWSIVHGLSAINLSNMSTTPNERQQLVLKDAIQGFIKNINQ